MSGEAEAVKAEVSPNAGSMAPEVANRFEAGFQ